MSNGPAALQSARGNTGSPPEVLDAEIVLNALPGAVIVVREDATLAYVNAAAEQLFDAGRVWLLDRALNELLPGDSPIFGLIGQVRRSGHTISEYDLVLSTPRIGTHQVSAGATLLSEDGSRVIVTLQEHSIARRIDDQLVHRNAARSVTAMAALLAHEVKNPLSGIRGAAQLLEQSAEEGERELTRLICDEADRIVALVDRMEVFSDDRPLKREPVNIHEVLEHVRRIAQNGFARHVRFVERYDPSLPPVYGRRDLLIQTLLNLVKNAAEAVSADDPEIVLSTSYRQGVRLTTPAGDRLELPLVIAIGDNGPGVPEDLRKHLFDPFVTGKIGGTGLGLALVAKIIGDHGGVIEFDSEPRRTVFRLMLPMVPKELR